MINVESISTSGGIWLLEVKIKEEIKEEIVVKVELIQEDHVKDKLELKSVKSIEQKKDINIIDIKSK